MVGSPRAAPLQAFEARIIGHASVRVKQGGTASIFVALGSFPGRLFIFRFTGGFFYVRKVQG